MVTEQIDTDAARATPPTAPRSVKSSERTLHVLELLGQSIGALSVIELHRRTGYPRSSLHQLLHTMAQRDWIEMSPDGSSVSIGTRALIVGTSYLDRDPALPFATRELERVRDEIGYTTHYARLDDDHVLYLATRETTNSHRRASRVGRRLPAHATALGKALLADLTSEERAFALGPAELVSLTDQTITDRAALEEELARTRERGYSIEREENTEGVVCIGVPVRYRIPASDAISAALPSESATAEEIERVGSRLVTHASLLAQALQSSGVR